MKRPLDQSRPELIPRWSRDNHALGLRLLASAADIYAVFHRAPEEEVRGVAEVRPLPSQSRYSDRVRASLGPLRLWAQGRRASNAVIFFQAPPSLRRQVVVASRPLFP